MYTTIFWTGASFSGYTQFFKISHYKSVKRQYILYDDDRVYFLLNCDKVTYIMTNSNIIWRKKE